VKKHVKNRSRGFRRKRINSETGFELPDHESLYRGDD